MGPEDARLQDVRGWLAKANLDLRAAAHEASAPAEGLWGDVMFHAQQAAEKSLKVSSHGTMCRFGRRTTLKTSAGDAWRSKQRCNQSPIKQRQLSEYAWKFRYPGEADEPQREEAEAALAAARNIYEEILTRLPAKARP
jgi:HEPN domain-containing protein